MYLIFSFSFHFSAHPHWVGLSRRESSPEILRSGLNKIHHTVHLETVLSEDLNTPPEYLLKTWILLPSVYAYPSRPGPRLRIHSDYVIPILS